MFDDLYDYETLDPEIEEFIDFLDEEESENIGFLSKKTVKAHFNEIGQYLNNLMVYPDRFVDIMTPKASHFHLFFFQRIIMRCMARGNMTYATFSRGTSKSFLADLDRYIKCMTVPRHNTTITAGTNKQAAEIAKQKVVDDLWVKFPLLGNEMQKRQVAGKLLDAYKMGHDYVEFNFRNGSSLGLGNVRGLRRESLIFEEVIEQDETKVNEVYIPLLNRPRTMSNGLINPHEPQSQQIYITTAGYQNTFAYQKMIDILCRSVMDPAHYFVLTGTYRIPLFCKLTSPQQIQDVINSPSFSKESFEREYESRWSDAPAGAAFNTNIVASLRQIKTPEFKDMRTEKQKEDGVFYVICADLAKDGAAETAVGVAKVTPKDHYFTYKMVNLYTVSSSDYMVIANNFKEAVLKYNARLLVYDANGVGAGLRDWLNKQTTDAKTGVIYEGLGIINPPTSIKHDIIRYPSDKTVCYEIKSGGQIGEQIHWFFFSRMSIGAITYPMKLNEALELYGKNKSFLHMSNERRGRLLSPFKVMDKMEEELKNLDIVKSTDQVSNRLRISRRNMAIQKDFFSMAEYLVWAVNQYIELDYYKNRQRRNKKRIISFID